MNRIEFMETLSRLLLDIPEEDRIDALKYYNDYFDDAGSENEQNVIEELESPEKVAMKIKADREDTGTTEEYDTDTGKGQAERTSDSEYKAQTDTENTYQYYQEDRSGDEKDNKIDSVLISVCLIIASISFCFLCFITFILTIFTSTCISAF